MPARVRALIANRIGRIGTEHRHIARDMSLIVGFVLVAKAVGAAKEIAIAWRYGISQTVDAYLFVFNLINFPISVWYGILTAVFIPVAARLRAENPAELPRFQSELFGGTILTGLALGLACWAALSGLFSYSFSGLPGETAAIAARITPWLAVLVPFGLIAHYGSVRMMSERRHANTLFEALQALAIFVAVLSFSQGGVWVLVAGTLVGALLHMIVVLGGAHWGRRLEPPRFSFASPGWQLFLGSFGIMLLGQILISMSNVVDQFFAVGLEAGSVSALGYSNRITSLVLSLGATAIARAVLPIFSDVHAKGGSRAYTLATHWAQIMMVAGAAVLVVGWVAAPSAVALLFERGAFTVDDTARVAEVLRYSLLQVPFYFAAVVASSAVLSGGKYGLIAKVGGANLAVKLLVSFALVPAMGLPGLVLATAIMYLSSFVILSFCMRMVKSKQ